MVAFLYDYLLDLWTVSYLVLRLLPFGWKLYWERIDKNGVGVYYTVVINDPHVLIFSVTLFIFMQI